VSVPPAASSRSSRQPGESGTVEATRSRSAPGHARTCAAAASRWRPRWTAASLYRHRDLHAQVLAKAAEPPVSPTTGPAVSRASLIADLANAHERVARLTQHNTQLQGRLSELLGEQAWRESGLGAPPDVDALQRRITELEQQAVEHRRQIAERDDDLEAARAANRDLITRLNAPD
jgi:hypothetical protein